MGILISRMFSYFLIATMYWHFTFGGYVPESSIQSLQAIYEATNGLEWVWQNISEVVPFGILVIH